MKKYIFIFLTTLILLLVGCSSEPSTQELNCREHSEFGGELWGFNEGKLQKTAASQCESQGKTCVSATSSFILRKESPIDTASNYDLKLLTFPLGCLDKEVETWELVQALTQSGYSLEDESFYANCCTLE